MAEYSSEQRNQLSRAITNSEAKSKQLKGFVDNRNTIIHRTAPVLQQKQAEPESVAGDMLTHLECCFCEDTVHKYNSYAEYKMNNHNRLPTKWNIIERIRPQSKHIPITVNYKSLGKDLPTRNELLKWLREPKKEHMWINHGGAIKVESRNKEKKPHPTLAGGDPDVSCAGLMHIDSTSKKVVVNNNSGHFKPDNVGQDSIDAIKTALDGAEGYSVETKNR